MKRPYSWMVVSCVLVFWWAQSEPAAAQYCDPPGAAALAGTITTTAVNAFTAAAITAQTEALILALQGHAAQVSSNIRGTITASGMISEAKSNQDTQRLVQGDQVAAIQANQFSTPLCQASTGSTTAIAMQANSVPDAIVRSQANAVRSAGTNISGGGGGIGTVAASSTANFQARIPLYCDASDPACNGTMGSRPQGDKMPGALLAVSQLQNQDDITQANWVIQNLTQPVQVPALTAHQVGRPGGRETYLRRAGYETQLNLAKDLTTEIIRTRREPTGDPNYYNTLATESGLPVVTAQVSLEDVDRMRFRDRFTEAYHSKIGALNDQTVLLREVVALLSTRTAERHRTNELLERRALLRSALVAALVEGKLATVGAREN